MAKQYLDEHGLKTFYGAVDAQKQDKLIAGDGLQLNGTELAIDDTVARKTDIPDVATAISGKQDTLTAGENITIENNVIIAALEGN